ncbi:ABC transporter permease [Mesorhizobium sp. NZP2077]|uniref:ABC transporter permease n=1 Tax=Mesorhizobium sp. NZP2077 TaxID=2483404 RepID=UPI001554031A|nr:ABC transporter permease [Mesorhizobium sp. NZP2077]QKC86022.1 ABC transporter permease [Mesorhizobium sp. NZP2077]QKD14654.1 ABC transporter permease [Mesorhizobium sp. NZP2077]
MDYDFYLSTMWSVLKALPLTLEIWFFGIAFGLIIATGLTWLRASGSKSGEYFTRAYVFVFRGSPLLVQLYLIYFGLSQFDFVRHSPILWPILRDPMYCTIVAMALNTAAYESEIFRGALRAVPVGQIEAAKAFGMSAFTRFRIVTLPIALRLALPAYSTEIILMTKATALASVVTIMEMMGTAQKIQHDTFRPIEVLTCAGVIYLLLNLSIARLFAWVEYRLSPHLRPAPDQSQQIKPVPEVL